MSFISCEVSLVTNSQWIWMTYIGLVMVTNLHTCCHFAGKWNEKIKNLYKVYAAKGPNMKAVNKQKDVCRKVI